MSRPCLTILQRVDYTHHMAMPRGPMFRAIVLSASVLATTLAGCKQSGPPKRQAEPVALKAPPATPIAEKKDELGTTSWNPQWDLEVEKALPADLLSAEAARAVHSYCPNFAAESEEDKRSFWAYVFQALAGAEAGLEPTTSVHHTQAAVAKIDTVTGHSIRQQGLLQLTYQDAERYGCDFDWEHDKELGLKDADRTILQPEKNLKCGVKIMENQIIKQKKPLIVRSSYWSTLQPGTKSYRVFAKQMANVPAACGVGTRTHRHH